MKLVRQVSGGRRAARGLHAPELARDGDGAWWCDFQGWVALFKANLTLVSPEKVAVGDDGGWRLMVATAADSGSGQTERDHTRSDTM